MYKQVKKKKLGRKKSHRDSLVRNLLRSLFENNTVVTTTPKAKVLKQKASSLVMRDKNETLAFRRELQNIFGSDSLVKKYQEYIKKENVGVGMVRVGFRAGDNAEVSRVFLLGLDKKKKVVKEDETKDEKKEKVVEKKEVKQVNVDKRVDKTAVIRKTERARSRAGI